MCGTFNLQACEVMYEYEMARERSDKAVALDGTSGTKNPSGCPPPQGPGPRQGAPAAVTALESHLATVGTTRDDGGDEGVHSLKNLAQSTGCQ